MFDETAGRPRLAAEPKQWFLSADERGNADTLLDHRSGDGLAWSRGNQVRPLVHGAVYFAELLSAVEAMEAGDRLMFTDWRGDPGRPPRPLNGRAPARGAVEWPVGDAMDPATVGAAAHHGVGARLHGPRFAEARTAS